ncbi:TIGR02099 family protein [Marinobacterium nitratireducens]|uniref:TIGR02099 family protein n=1 Tax=Marinobacterium nitratireducens TaxID=518897 RepID=A0A918DUD5_9GAMM|nr:YhdP family protein [Marinobacterium nitratireducens]GGO82828.1 TIGR02099 family protein [Marinobacterium nitratireducens]
MVRRTLGWLGWACVALALVVALAFSLARYYLPAASAYRDEVAGLLTRQLGVPIAIGTLEADWAGRWPRITLTDVRAYSESDAGPEVRSRLARVSLQFDLLRSLRHLAPVFGEVEAEGLELLWRQRGGRWLHRPRSGDVGSGLDPVAWQRALALVMLQPQLGIRNTRLTLIPEQGAVRSLTVPELILRNSSTEHQLSGLLDLQTAVDAGQLRFAVETRKVPENPLTADYDFYLSLDDIGPELPNLADLPLELASLSLGTEFWGRLSGGELDSVNGRLRFSQLRLDDPRFPAISDGATDFALLRRPQGYQLQLNQLGFVSAGEPFELEQLVLDGDWQARKLLPRSLGLPALDLAQLGRWLQVQPFAPEVLQRSMQSLAPRGTLRNLRVDLPADGSVADFRLAGDLEGGAIDAGWGAPAVAGIQGRLEADRNGGRIHLASDDFDLFFPELYDSGWHYRDAGGVVGWRLAPDGVVIGSQLLHLGNDSVNAAGRFSMVLPFDREQQSELTLMIGMTDSDALQAPNYVPSALVGPALTRWLDGAIGAGRLKAGGLVVHAGTRRLESRRPPTVQLFFDVDRADFAYQPGWPAVSAGEAFMLLRDRTLLVEVERGRFLDSAIEHGRVYLEGPGAALKVAATARGGAGDILRLFRESPLRQFAGDEPERWQVDGAALTELSLAIPLGGGRPDVSVASRLTEGAAAAPELRLEFAALQGDVFYRTATGVRSEGLGGRFLGEPFSALIRTPQVEPLRTRIELSGQMPVHELAAWSGVDLLDSLTGKSAYNARLELCAVGEGCNRLLVASDLRGVAAPWPNPLGKSGNEQRPLQVSLDLNSRRLRFNYDQQLRAVFGLGGPLRARLTFGGERPEPPAAAGLWIDGYIDALDAAQVQALLEAQGWIGGDGDAAGGDGAAAGPLRELDLRLGRLSVGEQSFEQVAVQLKPAPWRLRVDTPRLAGSLDWPAGPGRPYQLDLERLLLPRPQPSASAAETPVGGPIDLGVIPAMDVRISELRLGERSFGNWRMAVRPQSGRLRFDDIAGEVGSVDIQGSGVWQEAPAATDLTLKLNGKDLGDVLAAWGNGRVLESDHVEGYAQLRWTDRPWRFALAKASGELSFALESGRIIESGSASNLLRIFGVLNLNSLARRLKLDFSDLWKSGLAFDHLTGRYNLAAGRARTLEPLRLEGPSADMTMTGVLDAVAETVDQEMEVTLPLTSNIPLAAILLGAPQVAGAVFLIDKLIGDQLEKVTTVRYRLSGDWDNPEVSIIRTAPPAEKVFPGDR